MQPLIDVLARIAAALRRGPIAFAVCVGLAAVVLLPGLGSPGLWEPQERQLADRIAPPVEADAAKPEVPPAPAAAQRCLKAPPKDAAARSLTTRAVVAGRDHIADSDGGRRLPLALLGILTVLAAAGLAMRTGGGRAGAIAAGVLLAMPLLGLQTRMLTSDIGTACGAALVVYALVALALPRRSSLLALALDLLLSAAALAAGLVIGFYAGGALLGLVVPLGAVAAAGGLGAPLVRAIARREPVATHVPALLATLLATGLLALLAYQLYDLREPALAAGMVPPARQVAGHAIVGEGCYSWALGAVWRVDDDIRYIFDSSFEQVAYGTYPWGILGPIAMVLLLRDPSATRRAVGAVTLAWAGGAWIAAEVMHRKGGTMTLWAGFPALAIAIGVWLDGVLARRAASELDEPAEGEPRGRGGALLIGLFVLLAALTFGKDIQSFTEKLSSLVAGSEVAYPAAARVLGIKAKAWVLGLGVATAGALAVALGAWKPGASRAARRGRRIALLAATAAALLTIALGLFWTLGWHRRLSVYLSSKTLFETYREHRQQGDQLVMMGDLGFAPRAYAPAGEVPEQLTNRAQVVAALKREHRVFAITPLAPAESCALHRDMGESPYFVVDDRSVKHLLLSNRLGTLADKNPLRQLITRTPPAAMQFKPSGRVVFDNKIELLGWDLPQKLERGAKLEIVTYWKILGDVGGNWTMLAHIDGPGGRIRGGDHKPIKDRCPTSTWKTGDYVIDRHTMTTSGGSYPPGVYDVWLGFFTGSSPNFKNMTVSVAPEGMRDANDRAKVTKLVLE